MPQFREYFINESEISMELFTFIYTCVWCFHIFKHNVERKETESQKCILYKKDKGPSMTNSVFSQNNSRISITSIRIE